MGRTRTNPPAAWLLVALLMSVSGCSLFSPAYEEFAVGARPSAGSGGAAPSGAGGTAGAPGSLAGGSAAVDVCNDGQLSSSETSVDCGGLCPPCNAGKGCVEAADCTTRVCTKGLCQQATCHDSVQNGDETAIDCGGVCEKKCDVGQDCQSPYDCSTSVCAGTCQAASCTDGAHNGEETAIDCGGACDRCPNGQPCQAPADCKSGSCFHNICVSAGCTDQVKNGDETGVDCGGSCAPCAGNSSCNQNSDCLSLVCDPPSHACAAASCSDGVLNGSESAIDCGTGCTGCATGQSCTSASDCNDGLCKGDVCVPATPSGVKLSRQGWIVSASNSDHQSLPNLALDGDTTSGWSSGIDQVPGIWFKLDMTRPQLFFSVVLDARVEPSNLPAAFDVFLSNDDNFVTPAKVGVRGSGLTTIDFGGAQLVRYVYFRLSGTRGSWWSIDELNVVQ